MDKTEAAAILGMALREVTAVAEVPDGVLVTTHDGNTWHVATKDGEVVRYGDDDELRRGRPVVSLFDGPARGPGRHPENLRTPLYSGSSSWSDVKKPGDDDGPAPAKPGPKPGK